MPFQPAQLAFMKRGGSTSHVLESKEDTTITVESESPAEEANITDSSKSSIDKSRAIQVQKTIDVPFDSTVAFNAFSNLPRQAEFSPWLRKVEYIKDIPAGTDRVHLTGAAGETRWSMSFSGISFSWNAVCTKLSRPSVIEWESVSGMKNFGRVDFIEKEDGNAECTLTMTFVAPKLVAALFRRSNTLANFVQNRIVLKTLENFRDIVAKENEGKLLPNQDT